MCNGTCLIILKLGKNVLEAEIASGVNRGKSVLIPRIMIIPSDTDLPFTLRRHQFPIRPCFAMSTNKAQGQTLEFVGIYLPDDVFTHGQLYVVFSRVQQFSAVAVYVNNIRFTRNIVYKKHVVTKLSITKDNYGMMCFTEHNFNNRKKNQIST